MNHESGKRMLRRKIQSIIIVSLAGLVRRKVMVLDLDETLIHSHHDGVLRQTVKPGTPPDFVLKVHTTTISCFDLIYITIKLNILV